MIYFKHFIALIVPFLGLCVQVNAASVVSSAVTTELVKPTDVKFDYRGRGKFYSNANGSTSQGVVVEVNGIYQKSIMDNLEMSFKGGFVFESDRTQDFYVDKSAANRISMNHALIKWQANKNIDLQAGALNQKTILDRQLLVGNHAFPAAAQTFKFKYNDFEFGLQTEQAIPTSRTYSTKVVESELTPTLFFEDLFFNYNFNNNSKLKLSIGYFAFYDLPALVAQDSGMHGNIVANQGLQSAYFVFPFQGWSLKTDYLMRLSENYNLTIGAEYVNNIKAPASLGQAQSVFFKVMKESFDAESTIKLSIFEQQRQAAPSYYLDDIYGYSNRTGFALDVKHKFKNKHFYIGFDWVESQLLEVSPEQSDQRTIQIYLGVDNA